MNPWLGIAGVLGVLAGLLAGLQAWQRRHPLHPELSRKLVHIGMGLVALSFPRLFDRAWPVLLMSGVALAGLIAVRRCPPLRQRLGGIIGGVARQSYGELYFALAVGLLFWSARGEIVLYCVPLLLLTLADAVSALIGVRFGQRFFTTDDGTKSAEGSLAFFLVAFLSALGPLALFTEASQAKCLLIASILALLLMIIEAISWRGLDNLFIPLGGLALLKTYLPMDSEALTVRLIAAVAIVACMFGWRRRTTLKDSAMLASALAAYGCWAVGGWRWLVAPLSVLLSYPWITPPTPQNTGRVFGVDAVMGVSFASMAWLFLARTLARPDFLFPFTLAFAAQLAMIGLARLRTDSPKLSATGALARATAFGWVLLFTPYVWMNGGARPAVTAAAVGLVGVAFAAVGYYLWSPGRNPVQGPADPSRWLRQAGLASASSMAGLLVVRL